MNRRLAIFRVWPPVTTVVAVLLLAAPLAAEAQPAGKVPRIGVLSVQSPEVETYVDALRDGLRELGYLEGLNIAIEWRWARGRPEQLPDLAAELERLKVDVIVASNNPAIAAARRATQTIPIVMVLATDPVGLGFITSLARPGGNITGLSTQTTELAGKRLQFLREVVPHLSRLAILWDPSLPGFRDLAREYELAARVLGMQPRLLEVRSLGDLDSAFAAMRREGVDAVFAQGTTITVAHRARLAELAVKSRLPIMCATRPFVEAGCLMSYFASLNGLFQRAAYFVDRILKGAKPADLPVQQPTKFELVINAKTAKALGLTIPPSLLLSADQIID